MLTDAQWAVLEPLIEAGRPQGQDATPASAAHDVSHRLAASERRQMALTPHRAWAVVDGGSDLHPLGAPGRLGAAAALGSGAQGSTGDDVSGRHERPGSPESGRGGAKGGSSAERDRREALGRSRGG